MQKSVAMVLPRGRAENYCWSLIFLPRRRFSSQTLHFCSSKSLPFLLSGFLYFKGSSGLWAALGFFQTHRLFSSQGLSCLPATTGFWPYIMVSFTETSSCLFKRYFSSVWNPERIRFWPAISRISHWTVIQMLAYLLYANQTHVLN